MIHSDLLTFGSMVFSQQIIHIGPSDSKESAFNAGDSSLIPGSGRASGEGSDYLLQYCLENSMDRGAWQATVYGVAKSQTRLKQLSSHVVVGGIWG